MYIIDIIIDKRFDIMNGGILEMKGNVIVGQSGGPTAVINSSLAGVYKTCILYTSNDLYKRKTDGELYSR